MSTSPLCTLVISTDVPSPDRDQLIVALQALVDLQPETHRFGAAEWIAFVAIAKDVGILAGSATALLKLAEVVVSWVQNLRKRQITPKAKLQRPGIPHKKWTRG